VSCKCGCESIIELPQQATLPLQTVRVANSQQTRTDTLHLPTNGWVYRIGKRVFDFLISIALLPLFLLLAAVVAILVKVSSPGPVFYKHLRIGAGGKPFRVWKFRTMIPGSEHLLRHHLSEDADARQEWNSFRKLKDDPRVTRIGAFLRRTNLDELPQIFNVLAGEMSLVGPRPVMEEELERYGAGSALYKAVLPGMTGLWQVSGRGCLPYERRVALDVEYGSTWSLTRDLMVLTKTLNAVWTCRGAF
jgi:exopolysaccharide production protein ExoY